MPAIPPPAGGLSSPAHVEQLAAGTRLWRIHSARRGAAEPNPTTPKQGAGGRFDSDDGSYAYLYAGDSHEAAIAEALCRDLPLGGAPRIVPAAMLRNRLLTALEVIEDLQVASLRGPHLSAIGQDLWLTESEAVDYPLTRRWAAAILEATPAVGLAYRCRHDEDRLAWILTAPLDHANDTGLRAVVDSTIRLDDTVGKILVSRVLDAHSAVLSTR
ncbi:RES family NAD+ phosphorylase [Tomitella fengzijianii]|uniref:RES domain-containing protein n=1 Tax=Tomitella fengzijianii TaxID=2597660 RepID=A0A516X5T4_9ACTN|nr:RES family NAD+ phosphorylase [Tomitella fengzijianii]QDQ98419.1 RES domain-containing protein [Tomitella fengzijianii]